MKVAINDICQKCSFEVQVVLLDDYESEGLCEAEDSEGNHIVVRLERDSFPGLLCLEAAYCSECTPEIEGEELSDALEDWSKNK